MFGAEDLCRLARGISTFGKLHKSYGLQIGMAANIVPSLDYSGNYAAKTIPTVGRNGWPYDDFLIPGFSPPKKSRSDRFVPDDMTLVRLAREWYTPK